MQLSLRSQMIAGVAALGVSAIAVAPVVQPELAPAAQRLSSAVNLVGLDSPLGAILGTVDDVFFNIFDQASVPPPAELFWPDSFYTEDFSFLFAPGYWGALPDFVNQFSNGGLSAVISNLSGYVSAASYGLLSAVSGPTTAIWNTPFALITAAGYLAAGQPNLALAELQTQIVDPIVQSVSDVLQAVGYIVDNSIANAGTIIGNTIPTLLANVIGTVVSGTTYVVQSALGTLGGVVSDLVALQFEDAWNGAVNGLLGINGTLGQIENLVVGVGIIEPVEYEDEGTVDTVVIPSLRSDLTSAGQRLGDLSVYGEGGIRNDPFVPEAAAAAATVPAPLAAAVRAEVTEVTEAAPADTTAATAATAASEVAEAAPEVVRPSAGEAATDAAAAAETATAPAADSASPTDDAPKAEKSAPSKHAATRRTAKAGSES